MPGELAGIRTELTVLRKRPGANLHPAPTLHAPPKHPIPTHQISARGPRRLSQCRWAWMPAIEVQLPPEALDLTFPWHESRTEPDWRLTTSWVESPKAIILAGKQCEEPR